MNAENQSHFITIVAYLFNKQITV